MLRRSAFCCVVLSGLEGRCAVHEAKGIANEFIQRALEAEKPLTPMQIQKLVYFAHARMLALHGTGLIHQEFRAWPHGPVIESLYEDLKRYRGGGVLEVIPMVEQGCLSSRENDIVKWAFDRYSPLSAWVLSELSHAPGGPWARAKAKSQGRPIITNQAISEYHAQVWQPETSELAMELGKLPTLVEEYEAAIGQLERGEYHSSTSPDEMIGQIAARAASHS